MLGQGEAIKDYQNKFPWLFLAITLLFVLLFTRVVYLQVFRGAQFRRFSEQNSLRKEKLPGPRGRVMDRDGRVLVDNRLQLDLVVHPQFVGKARPVIDLLAELAGENPDRLWDRYLKKAAINPKFQPVTVIENVPWNVVVKVESLRTHLPGVDILSKIRRTYLDEQVGAQVFGYLSEVTKKDIEEGDRLGLGYELGDFVGRAGLERKWEKYLRGNDGFRFVEVDAHGHRVVRSSGEAFTGGLPAEVPPTPGNSLVLTIDRDLQLAAAEAMRGKMGAVVALDPRTGEVLTMLSQPGFDPTEMGSKGPELWQSFVNNPWGPLRNKAIQDHFPPGSTFKTFSALAALENGVVTPQTRVFCPGFFRFGNRIFHCHKKEGHGSVDLHDAIMKSCDVYFYYVATRLSIDQISKVASDFGLGRKTGIALSNEASGLMPTEEWKQKTFNQQWSPGETLSAVIGQGYNLVTPLQLALAYSTVVNGGNLYRPYVVSRVEGMDGNVVQRFEPELISSHKVKPEILDVIKAGLHDVVNAQGGTAFRSVRIKDLEVSGKSGTSQVVSLSKEELFRPCHMLPFEKRHHAWFVGFAPSDNPQIVVVTFGQHECAGSAVSESASSHFSGTVAGKEDRPAHDTG